MDSVYVPSTWRRLVAQGIDQIIRLLFYIPFMKSFFLLVMTDEDVRISLGSFVLMFLIPAIYEFIFLVLMQATPGKWLMGLKVVPFANSAAALDWRQCVLRPLTERLTFFFSWAVYAVAFFRYDRTHLADWVAETRVVQFHPRITRAKIRWILGSLLLIFYVYDGIITSKEILKQIDWAHRQVELRSLFDVDSMSDMVEEYEEL